MGRTQRRVLVTSSNPGEKTLTSGHQSYTSILPHTFYNFPYTFGFLMSRGLYAMFKKEGSNFLRRYEEFSGLPVVTRLKM